jgi:DsbE subfamily thiol:disulfide oxidoreductase
LPSTPSSSLTDAPHRSRRVLVAIATIVVITVGAVTWWVVADSEHGTDGQLPQAEKVNVATVGQAAPDFRLQTLDGKTVQLSDLRGKPVLVNFWASWCTPCRDEFPFLRRTVAAHPGIVVLGLTEDTIVSDARSFVRQQHAAWPMLDDSAGQVAREFGVKPIPQTFFVDRNGTITVRVNGPLPLLSSQQFAAELAKVDAPATPAPTG